MIRIQRYVPLDDIRFLIWDLDGTLVDSMADLAASVNALRNWLGFEALETEVIRGFVGSGVSALIQKSLGMPLIKRQSRQYNVDDQPSSTPSDSGYSISTDSDKEIAEHTQYLNFLELLPGAP